MIAWFITNQYNDALINGVQLLDSKVYYPGLIPSTYC